MGLIILNDFKERWDDFGFESHCLWLRWWHTTKAPPQISIHGDSNGLWGGVEWRSSLNGRGWLDFVFVYFILVLILCVGIVCECLYSSFKMPTCHYLIGGVNSWLYAKTRLNVNSIGKVVGLYWLNCICGLIK